MDEKTARRLVEINRQFYAEFAQPFAETRSDPQPGFEKVLRWLPPSPFALLDVGCGDGRFGRFVRERGNEISYTGVDMTPELLAFARSAESDLLLVRDLSQPNCLADLPTFDCIVCLSTLQHVPGHLLRVRLLTEFREHLAPKGVIVLGNWQFMGSDRQRRKLVDWSTMGLDPADVGTEDYLMSWNRGGMGVRYVANLDKQLTAEMVSEAGLQLRDSFYSDGREGNLNLYSILTS